MASRCITLLCLLAIFLLQSSAYADALFDIRAEVAVAAEGFLPSNAVNTVPVSVPVAVVGTLAEGDELTVALPDGSSLDYRIDSLTVFGNGDIGVRAVLQNSPDAGNYLISLTIGTDAVLATIYVPGAKFGLQTRRVGDSYLGYLYRESPDLPRLPADLDPPAVSVQIDALSDSDVSITQSFSNKRPLIGETVDVSIELTNSSGSSINDETLRVLFVLDNTEFVDANAGCTPQQQLFINGSFKELRCPISNLAAGASLNITYTVRITAATIPYTSSTVILDQARHDEFLSAYHDTLKDTDNDGISDFNEGLLGTNPLSNSSGPAEGTSATVDLLFLYTPRYTQDSSPTNPLTAINQLLQENNDMYATSGTGIQFRAVMYQPVNYQQTGDLGDALDALEGGTGAFQDVEYYRAISGADLVVLILGLSDGDNACGIAQGTGDNSLGDFSWESVRGTYTTMYKPGPDTTDSGICATDTLAHELGHLFGLDHSRAQNSSGTFGFSLGYGVSGSFHTIMAYSSAFPDAEALSVFSNPASSACKGQPCGISEIDADNGANAVLSLRTTRFQVSRYYGTRPVLAMANVTGSSTAATAAGGVIRTGGAGGADTSFGNSYGNQDQLNLAAVINVDPSHVGQTGVTHIVLAADGLGYFQVNSSGGIVPWDGSAETLVGAIAPRALQSVETLQVFRDLVFNDVGVPAANLTVFFAYALQNSSTFVYTSSGVSLQIQ